jgi:hypothetical protein
MKKTQQNILQLKAIYQPEEKMIRLVIHNCFYCKKEVIDCSPQYSYGDGVSLMYFLCPLCTEILFKNEIEQYNVLSQVDSILDYFEKKQEID